MDVEVDQDGHVLPADFLRLVFAKVSIRTLCTAAQVCSSWNELVVEGWQARASARWRSLKSVQEPGGHPRTHRVWQQLYAKRHLVDLKVLRCVERAVWPHDREDAIRDAVATGELGLECLQATANSTSPLCVGTRYWSTCILQYMQASRAAAALSDLVRQPPAAVPIEAGALLIAQVQYPAREVESEVMRALDALGAEAVRRMQAQGVRTAAQALKLLSSLLFGEADPEQDIGNDSDSDASSSSSPTNGGLLQVPAEPWGLGLRGNQQDYYNPRNSLMNEVLHRRLGIPISLAIVHAAVARRAGLHVQLLNMPMHIVSVLSARSALEFEAAIAAGSWPTGGHTQSDTTGATGQTQPQAGVSCQTLLGGSSTVGSSGGGSWPGAGQVMGGGHVGGGAGREEEGNLYVDAFNAGRIMTTDDLKDFMSELGISIPSSRLLPLTPQGVYSRMCANLVDIYSSLRDYERLRVVLELACAVNPTARDMWYLRSSAATKTRDYADALAALDGLQSVLLAEELLPSQRAMVAAQVSQARTDIATVRADYLATCAGQRRRAEVVAQQQQQQQQQVVVAPGEAATPMGESPQQTGTAPVGAGSGHGQVAEPLAASSPVQLSGPGAVAAAAAVARSPSSGHSSAMAAPSGPLQPERASPTAPAPAALATTAVPSAAAGGGAAAVSQLGGGWDRPASAPSAPGGSVTVSSGVKFHVGQLVRHKRYHYRGVVYGWDPVCASSEDWIQSMGVDGLPGGRAQPFYKLLVDERDRPFQNTYVAQCNLELLYPDAGPGATASPQPVTATRMHCITATRLAQLAPDGVSDTGVAAGGSGASSTDVDQGVPASATTVSGTGDSSTQPAARRAELVAGGAAVIDTGSGQPQPQLPPPPQPQALHHPDTGQHFEGLCGSAYVPNAYLRYRFPDDHTCQGMMQLGESGLWEIMQLMPGVSSCSGGGV